MVSMHRQKILVFILFLICVFFLQTVASSAQPLPQLDLKTTVEKEAKVKKKGKQVWERIPVEKTAKGDILVYTITYLNKGKTEAVDAQIIDPIPVGVVIIPESAEGKDAEVTCSTDSGKSWQKPPLTMQITKPDGTKTVQPVPAEKYTHIRWIIKKPVLPGQTGRVNFKASVK
ncbi:MAG TPA: hypothetical protein PKN70_00410 [Smithellaceae bacterium]|jgi:uncharacterized repeat protein (TIGR01451 family)|nr:hypothetical protein [Smithellaceae bacterium]HQM45666.1 hypothetical protein [Smithellaceae bacterium]